MSPLVSIIVPVYNVADYIVPCLSSVISQTYNNIEIVLVDDCGKDDSINIAANLLSSSSIQFTVLHHDQNKGVSVARNDGLMSAQGEYIYFLDSDDELTCRCIELLVKPLESFRYDMVVGGYSTFGNEEKTFVSKKDFQMTANKEVVDAYARGLWHVMPWNKLCRKAFLLDNGLYFLEGQALHEDFLWSFETACKANSVFLISEATYRYRFNESSAMNSASIETDLAAYIPAFRKMIKFSKSNGLESSASVYQMIEGKKNGILYSLLQRGDTALYRKYYSSFHVNHYLSPFAAYRNSTIGMAYLFRDLDNSMPSILGRLYKRIFFYVVYKLRGKKIEGALWV